MLSRRFSATAQSRRIFGQQIRRLNVHEYASKQFLAEYGCKTEFGIMCQSVAEVAEACKKIKTEKKVVKSQILAGGRGRGEFTNGLKGGVHVCDNAELALEMAEKMLGGTLVTKQTGEKGLLVNKLFVTEAIPNIKRELYLALLLDRVTCSPTFIAAAEGGMGIEDLAAKSPEKIKKMPISIHQGIQEDECMKFAASLGFDESGQEKVTKQLVGIYNLAKAKDATMVEINPLVELDDGEVMCIDAKVSFDDNAQFRRPEVWELEDLSQKDPKEVEADKADLNYIALDGDVGCMVNGAGLAMSTMDLISLNGYKPANFLDAGGSAQTTQIIKAFEIISSDKNVKCLLVNIFGGIVMCDMIANGIVQAVNSIPGFSLPIVVRLEGSNDEKGRKILAESGLKLYPVNSLKEAGTTVAEVMKKL